MAKKPKPMPLFDGSTFDTYKPKRPKHRALSQWWRNKFTAAIPHESIPSDGLYLTGLISLMKLRWCPGCTRHQAIAMLQELGHPTKLVQRPDPPFVVEWRVWPRSSLQGTES